MMTLFNKFAVGLFSFFSKMKGYQFLRVRTAKQQEDADTIFKNEGYQLPEQFEEEMEIYKADTIRFIAYYRGVPVGTVGLADPKNANRPYDLHGIDENGDHFEIQSLIVSKNHRECSQLVFLGLFKEMFIYSIKNGINTWISFGLRQLYMTIRRYNKGIVLVNMTRSANKNELGYYLYDNHIFDSCSILNVNDFSPTAICLKFLKKRIKKMENKIRFLFL